MIFDSAKPMSKQLQQTILAIAMDLKRVTVGFQSNSDQMYERFLEEAVRVASTIKEEEVKEYI